MKKISVVFIAIFAVGLLLNSTGKEMIVHVKPTDHAKTIALYLVNLNKNFTNINIYSLEGENVYFDQVWNKWAYASNLDLSALPPGDYMLNIKNRDRNATVALFITEDRVAYVNNDHHGFALRRKASFEPTPFSRLMARFYTDPDAATLNLQLANLREAPTTIKVASVEGATIYYAHFTGEIGYHKRIHLGAVADGTYFVHLNTIDAKVFQMMSLNDGKVRFGPTMGKEKALLYAPDAVAAN
jgi:hypothetical protein